MGANDIPPPRVYQHTVLVANLLLQTGGVLWTLCYILLARESYRSKTYGMPLFALSANLGWEVVYALYLVEPLSERIAFSCWLAIDIFIVFGFVKFGVHEWEHHPWVKRHLGLILAILTAWWALFQWACAKFWLDNAVNNKPGKWYFGKEGPDMTELAFWVSSFPQIGLSLGSLANLITRQHTGGVSWEIWITRSLGSALGYTGYFIWMWYQWREAHEYVMSPIGILLWATYTIADIIYGFVFAKVKETEQILPDGRKVAAHAVREVRFKSGRGKAIR